VTIPAILYENCEDTDSWLKIKASENLLTQRVFFQKHQLILSLIMCSEWDLKFDNITTNIHYDIMKAFNFFIHRSYELDSFSSNAKLLYWVQFDILLFIHVALINIVSKVEIFFRIAII
jgi:hypothetical protein